MPSNDQKLKTPLDEKKEDREGDEAIHPNDIVPQDKQNQDGAPASVNGEGKEAKSLPEAKKVAEPSNTNGCEQPKKSRETKQKKIIPAKRKAKLTPDEPSKAPRRSARGAAAGPVDLIKVANFLLSSRSLDFTRPKDEINDLQSRVSSIRTFSTSTFTPFEELVCAVILSRPISHALGVRSIRTLLNPPYEFTTPKAIISAAPEGRRKALDAARTQHRQKTADELGGLADAVVKTIGDGEDDVQLERVRKEAGHDAGKVCIYNLATQLREIKSLTRARNVSC